MSKTLDELLHGPSALPVLVKADGTYATAAYPPARLEDYAPESINIDWSGDWGAPDILESHERDALKSIENGWRALTGWSGRYLFIFDADQRYFGRDLEEHIAETPGLWAIVSVEMHPPACEAGEDGMPCADWTAHERCEHADYPAESQAAGWALIHKEVPRPLPRRVRLPKSDYRYRQAGTGTVTEGSAEAGEFRVSWSDGTFSVEHYDSEGRDWTEVPE